MSSYDTVLLRGINTALTTSALSLTLTLAYYRSTALL
jgi:hypothetical protein